MTSYERVQKTLRCEETDRVPIFDTIRCDAVAEHFSGMKLGAKASPDDEKVLVKAFDKFVDASKSFIMLPTDPGVKMVNGTEMEFSRWTSWRTKKQEYDYDIISQKAREIIKNYEEQFKNAKENAQRSWDNYKALSAKFNNTTFFHCIPPTGAGLYNCYNKLDGLDYFSYLLADDEELALEMIDKAVKCSYAFLDALPVDYAPIAALDSEDIAFKSGTIFSHDFLRSHLFPSLKKIVEKLNNRGVPVLFHSDGDLRMVLDDIVECGFTGIHPIEVLASMDIGEIREKYPKLVMCGGVDCSQLLPYGTPEEVYDTACENIRKSKNYGYFMGSSSEINDIIPPKNILAMLSAIEDMSKKQ